MNYSFDVLGGIHFGSAILAMITGMVIIFLKKGTNLHIKIGYTYAISMLILNVTALMIYDLFGGFGPFHVFAVISLATLIAGLIPAYLKKPEGKWLEMHYEFMNWSVVGLYAAFWSETFTRFFAFQGFWIVVGVATAVTVFVGAIFIKKKKSKILSRFSHFSKQES